LVVGIGNTLSFRRIWQWYKLL